MPPHPIAAAGTTAPPATVIGHPRGLFLLFFVELWERFSYYGMRALLIFYLTKHFLFSDDRAYAIYGAYTALVFITPVIGGYVADRWLGARRAVLFGGVLLTAGHLMMGFEGSGGRDPVAQQAFYIALSLIVAGVGFLKANVSVLVGHLYPRDDVRRDSGFTIFYIGINLGAALGPILCGWLGETWGWSYGFGAAGAGMAIGLAAFVALRRMLGGHGEPPDGAALAVPLVGVPREWVIYAGAVAGIVPLSWLIAHHDAVGLLLGACGAVVVASILWTALTKLAPAERDALLLALYLIALQPLFWGLYEQVGSSLNLFTDRHVDRHILGVEVPASLFQSVGAIFIVLIAPIFAWGWPRLARAGLEPSTPAKFGLALVQVGFGFLVLVWGATAAGEGPTPVVFILLVYLFHVTGELCLSPVGVAAMTRLAPAAMAGLVMGTWFLATAAGNFIASLIARATGGGGADSAAQVIAVYGRVGWIAVAAGAAVVLTAPLVMRRAQRGEAT